MSWQIIATVVCVIAAAVFLGRRILRFVHASAGGDSKCTGCAQAKQDNRLKQLPLVSLSDPGLQRRKSDGSETGE